MEDRHKEDWLRVEALSNNNKTEDHEDPFTPAEVHINEKPTAAERIIHPDTEEWRKANKHSGKKTTTQKGKQKKPQKNPMTKPQLLHTRSR
ncbi:hypothetical protein DSO57_1009041 [Entomophthora muscae]|uniref:Uncharacterized protein n=1 Tax=Entomophthora muscae TaxID=34485 RepID=A0ACC2UTJ7_9FUNG|nr:hypothetical protein DSO57_1009041 [Entomophthora muscae]